MESNHRPRGITRYTLLRVLEVWQSVEPVANRVQRASTYKMLYPLSYPATKIFKLK